MALGNSREVMDFTNTCHSAETGEFCSDGSALVSVKGNVSLANVKDTHPERLGSLQRTLNAISSVHGISEGLPSCSVEIWGTIGDAKGVYDQGKHLIKIGEDEGAFQASTLCHEFGHHLTLGVEGQGKVEFYSSIKKEGLSDWWAAVKATPEFLHFHNIEGSVTASGDARDYASYLKDPRELFARSYSQWIAARSGNPTLVKQNSELRKKADGMYQWSDSEFEPIGHALDAWFAKKGWLKSANT